MGTNVVSSWQQVVNCKLLRDGTKDPASCADQSLYASIVRWITVRLCEANNLDVILLLA